MAALPLTLEQARSPKRQPLSLEQARSVPASAPPPPSPTEVGLEQRESLRQQTLSQMQKDAPRALGTGQGRTVVPKPRYQWTDILGEGTASKVAESVTPLTTIEPADVVMPLSGATQRAAKGVAPWLARRFGVGGFSETAEQFAKRGAQELGELGASRLALPPARFEMQTAPADIAVTPTVVRKQTPPTLVPPSRQLPPATTQLPAATLDGQSALELPGRTAITLPEASRPVPAEAIGQRGLSLDDVRNRIAILEREKLLEREKPATPLQQARIDQELSELRAYLEPDQLTISIPEPQKGSRRTPIRARTEGTKDVPGEVLRGKGTPYYRPRQGELVTGGAIDVAPESRVYGAGPEDAERLAAQGELQRAEAARAATRQAESNIPKYWKGEPPSTLSQRLESIGYEVAPTSKQRGGAEALLSPESAVSTYPALKKVAQRISSRRLREAEIQRELTTLSQSAPTPANVSRMEKLQGELDSLAQSRAKNNLTAADEDEILSTIERMERDLPQADLGAAQHFTKPAKRRGLTRQQAIESVGESIRGPEFAPRIPRERRLRTGETIIEQPPSPTGATIRRGGLREPPSAKTPERFSVSPTPRETIKSPPLASPLLRSQTILRKIGGAAKEIAGDIETALAEGRLSGNLRAARLRDAGMADLTEQEAVNVADILQTGGKAQPVSDRARAVAQEARTVLDEIAQEAGGATPGGGPLMVRSQDGSIQIFTPLKNYFPHHVPSQQVLGDAKNALRKQILEDTVRRGEFDSLDEATAALDDYVAFMRGKAEKPKTLLAYFKRKNPAMGEKDILRLLEKVRTPTSKYGALEQHRTLDIPFYDPNAARALDYYTKHASRRLALTKKLGQQGEKINEALRRVNKSIVEGSATPDQVTAKVNDEIDKLLGQKRYDRDADAWSALLRTWQAFKIGPLTAVPNMFQDTLFGLMKTDFPTVAKAWGRFLTKQGRERAYRAGADMEQAIKLARMESGEETTAYLSSRAREMEPGAQRTLYAAGGKLQEVMGSVLHSYMNWNGFAKSELWQRAIGHNLGEVWAEKMSRRLLHHPNDKLARSALTELGLDPERIISQGGKFSDRDSLMAGMRLTDMLNFSNRPEDIASGFQSPFGRIVWQFKTFMYGATRLSYEGTVKEFQRGNYKRGVRNILHLAMTYPMAGEVVAVTRELMKDPANFEENMKKRYGEWDKNPLGKWLSNLGEMGAYAMVMSTLQSAGYGKIAEGAVGPAPAAAGEFLESGTRSIAKLPEDPGAATKIMAKWAVRHGPLSATLVYPLLKDQLSLKPEAKKSERRQGRAGRADRR